MKKTLKQRNLEFLKARGWVEDPKVRTSKYLPLTHPDADYHYFLGNAGAVRKGRTVTGSISVKLKLDDGKDTAYAKAAKETVRHDQKEKLTLEQVADKALEIIQRHEEGAAMDAGFDAGEFSGPAHARSQDHEIEALATANGFTAEQVHAELAKRCHEEDAKEDCLENYA